MRAAVAAVVLNKPAADHTMSDLLNELVGKQVIVVMGITPGKLSGFDDNVKGRIAETDGAWLKLVDKNDKKGESKTIYINVSHIKRILPQ